MVDLRQGDCRAVMAAMPAASVDAVVCDPPYGLEFMGKEWDHGVPGVAFWSAALRVEAGRAPAGVWRDAHIPPAGGGD